MTRIIAGWLLFIALSCAGCATTTKPVVPVSPAAGRAAALKTTGFYHKVARGQTLWRVARLYGIELDELAAANRITDAAKIETGQKLFIPRTGRPIARPLRGTQDEDFVWPMQGTVLARFGAAYAGSINKGLNIAPRRSPDVVASRSGTIVFCDDDFLDLGKTVIIEHPDGFWTVYARIRDVFVKLGDQVSRGTLIAQAGSAGRDRTVFLHFEIRKGAQPQNPLFYLP
ncbi:MAG: LysM peptidoglycan-binding domain-containing M23 family metallopeptidase [Candidatus Omnitrophica bacterium]|nr:LysM peptidoglycan-binding domain-containing M23 family metallopeptidase [Candidatus Omnitrophota bacterium]